MSTKTSVLELLEKHRGESLSGEELARILGVSRTAVWKAMNELKKEGFLIEAATNKGYRLAGNSNVLSVQGILPHLEHAESVRRIHLIKETESTNRTATKMVLEGAEEGTVVIAESQSEGRGRQGRNFFSPAGKGVYLSMVLRPEPGSLPNPAVVTTAASVAVCRAVQKATGQELQIKWVNDLFLNGKKVCGILTEAITDFEAGTVDWIVLGVGVNFSTLPQEFPDDMGKMAGALCPGSTDGALRNRLAAEVVNAFSHLKEMMADRSYLEEYRERLMMLGQMVTVLHPSGDYLARALDIDSEGRLLVEAVDGETRLLSSGEVRIRA